MHRKDHIDRKSKWILRYFGFLMDDYGMKFAVQTFHQYAGFSGPIYVYSFYNENGCFSFHYIVQRDEWGWYTSKNFSNQQNELMEQEINQKQYLNQSYNSIKSALLDLSEKLKAEIADKGSVFGIQLRNQV